MKKKLELKKCTTAYYANGAAEVTVGETTYLVEPTNNTYNARELVAIELGIPMPPFAAAKMVREGVR